MQVRHTLHRNPKLVVILMVMPRVRVRVKIKGGTHTTFHTGNLCDDTGKLEHMHRMHNPSPSP
jgi:hypothetical protein